MNTLISASEISNNFSKASSIVEKEGIAIVTKNNKPKFVILNFVLKLSGVCPLSGLHSANIVNLFQIAFYFHAKSAVEEFCEGFFRGRRSCEPCADTGGQGEYEKQYPGGNHHVPYADKRGYQAAECISGSPEKGGCYAGIVLFAFHGKGIGCGE